MPSRGDKKSWEILTLRDAVCLARALLPSCVRELLYVDWERPV